MTTQIPTEFPFRLYYILYFSLGTICWSLLQNSPKDFAHSLESHQRRQWLGPVQEKSRWKVSYEKYIVCSTKILTFSFVDIRHFCVKSENWILLFGFKTPYVSENRTHTSLGFRQIWISDKFVFDTFYYTVGVQAPNLSSFWILIFGSVLKPPLFGHVSEIRTPDVQ